MDCGRHYPFYVMQFDHRPGEVKSFNLSEYRKHNAEDVEAEIAKCDLVCANCHHIRTYDRMVASRVPEIPKIKLCSRCDRQYVGSYLAHAKDDAHRSRLLSLDKSRYRPAPVWTQRACGRCGGPLAPGRRTYCSDKCALHLRPREAARKAAIATCHPDRPHHALGLCSPCYEQYRYDRQRSRRGHVECPCGTTFVRTQYGSRRFCSIECRRESQRTREREAYRAAHPPRPPKPPKQPYEYLCRDCGVLTVRPVMRGRPPVRCPDCRPGRVTRGVTKAA
jgi:hypothetical protein